MNSNSDDVTRRNASADATGPSDRSSGVAEFGDGQIVAGRYQVIAPLGHGGMGVVYRVKQISTGAEFALKTIDRKRLTDITIRRFQQEARATFTLDHPNIVKVIEFGLLDEESPFLVMEIVDGENLGERLKRGSLSAEDAKAIFVQVCFGLSYAHQRGIVHRDIKPSNIMLVTGKAISEEGSIKILDFGIAKIAGREGGELQALTRTGEIFGSPLYMSPEQCTGEKVDHRSDIYSLGCVFFEALTGTPPWVGENALSTMMLHQSEIAPTLKEASLGSEFSPELEAISARLLAKKPENRYQDLGKTALDLAAINKGNTLPQSGTAGGDNHNHIANLKSTNNKSFVVSKRKMYLLLTCVAVISGAIGAFSAQNYGISKRNERLPEVEKIKTSSVLDKPTNQNSNRDVLNEIQHFPDDNELLRSLANPKENRLKMRNFQITRSFLAYVAELKHFDDLDFFQSLFTSPDCFEALRHSDIKHLKVNLSNFSDRAAKTVSHIKTLKIVDVASTDVTDEGIEALATLPHLEDLNIGGIKIGSRSFAAISKIKTLNKLGIFSHVTDKDIAMLANLKLTYLTIAHAQPNHAVFAQIADLKFLEFLILKQDTITMADLETVLQSKSLKTLVVNCKGIDAVQVRKLKDKYKFVRMDIEVEGN